MKWGEGGVKSTPLPFLFVKTRKSNTSNTIMLNTLVGGLDGRLGKNNKKGEGKNFDLKCLKIASLFG